MAGLHVAGNSSLHFGLIPASELELVTCYIVKARICPKTGREKDNFTRVDKYIFEAKISPTLSTRVSPNIKLSVSIISKLSSWREKVQI